MKIENNFNEIIKENNFDETKIIEEFKKLFIEGIRRNGSWERQTLESIFGDFEEFKRLKIRNKNGID